MALSGAMCNDSDSENAANVECVTIAECTREVQGAISRFIRSMVIKKKKKKNKRTLNQRRKIFNQVSSQSLLYIWFLCFNANGSFWTYKLILI